MEAVEELLEEIADNQDGFVSTYRVFNKPSLISISSADREADAVNQTPYSQTAFSSFSVNLPRPALEVDSIQLMSSNLPMCNNNIPDTSAVFWYYRSSLYSGVVPNSNNLFMNRLLPSYYKPELVNQASTLAFNKTFANYPALSTEMAKASANDLAYNNYITIIRSALEGSALDNTGNAYIPFRPNDMLVSYNTSFNKFQGTGLNSTPAIAAYNSGTTYALGAIVGTPIAYAPYNAGTTYAIGSVVIVNFNLYRSLVNGNVGQPVYNQTKWKNIGDLCFWNRPQTYISLQASNINHTPASSPTFWKEIGVDYIQPWDVGITYNVGRVVLYSGLLYISVQQVYNNIPSSLDGWDVVNTSFYRYLITGPRDPNVIPAQGGVNPFVVPVYPKLKWNEYALYEVGDRVEYNGQLWRCVQQNQDAIPQQVDTEWTAGTTYAFGTILRYRGVVYQALQSVPANYDPVSYNAYWEQITFWGWDNCGWRSSITYNFEDSVIYQGKTYRLGTESSLNQVPSPSSAVWDVIDENQFAPPAYGLYTLSTNYDFVEQIGALLDLPFPIGIQGQPFIPLPKRLLNTIMGFTFNGIFNADAFQSLLTPDQERGVLTQLTAQFNRLRPIPLYEETSFGDGLGAIRDPVSTATLVYTADGYCNLVYTSIIATYCDVVGASSIDTSTIRPTNLLAINSMNCANLGVSFYAPYLDNPLTKVQNDIYAIYVEFRDEFGDLFHFTNNAVVTLTFKVSYKK
jgi:chitodextrinase